MSIVMPVAITVMRLIVIGVTAPDVTLVPEVDPDLLLAVDLAPGPGLVTDLDLGTDPETGSIAGGMIKETERAPRRGDVVTGGSKE